MKHPHANFPFIIIDVIMKQNQKFYKIKKVNPSGDECPVYAVYGAQIH